MKIKINDEWSIEDNGSGYTLTKWTGKVNEKTQSPIFDVQKYPATLIGAIELYARLATIEEQEEMTLKGYIDSIKQKYQSLEHLLKGETKLEVIGTIHD